MKILIACEESQAVTIELRKRGHEAYSCDILPCSGGHPEWHIQGDVLKHLTGWDMIVAFPPCTHLALSGAKHFIYKRNDGRQREAIEFFFELWKAADCVENPMGILNGGKYIATHFPDLYVKMIYAGFTFKPSQIIQPWQFGNQAQKTTCLWLKKNMPSLIYTDIVDKGDFYISPKGKKLPAWYGDAVGDNGKKLSYNGSEIKKLRSKTFPGIARAMAEQWTKNILA